MNTTTREQVTGPAGVVADASASLDGLDEVLWAAKTPQELLDTKQQIETLRSRLCAVDARVCQEIDVTRASATEQYAAPADYLTAISGGYRGSGRRWLRTCRDLTGDRTATLAALQTGSVSGEHAHVICATVRKLPVKQEVRDAAERELLAMARVMDASELKDAGKTLLEALDPEGREREDEAALSREERAAHLNRFLSITDDGMGGVKLRGRGSTEDAAIIRAALMSLTAPEPAKSDTDSAGGADFGSDADQGPERTGSCDDSGRDTREYSTRAWDALVEGSQRLLDSEVLPTSHGRKPRVNVTIPLDDLLDKTGKATIETGESLSASAVRRLACDCDLIPVVLGSNGEVLDVGRVQRLVTVAIWAALVIRDMHCAFPGCRRPPIACDGHHLRSWLEGGPTSLANMCLLCRTHHVMIHDTGWDIVMNPLDQRPDFLPPRRLDPERKPIRDRCPRE
ncbi:MAG TPA: DUF222 domain-containing protein [Nocardioidaceae bacterium]|nr:DUF222 domain-containing protein [Nocardioidaceae bacterium]